MLGWSSIYFVVAMEKLSWAEWRGIGSIFCKRILQEKPTIIFKQNKQVIKRSEYWTGCLWWNGVLLGLW